MSFQPATPLGGVAGWAFLNRTFERQSESFASSAQITRETDYFREKIGTVTSAKDLVADRQLLKVALGAFGLEDDLNKGFFIRKILEEGSDNQSSMANRLVDKRYVELTDAFGFGSPLGPKNAFSGFADEMISSFRTRQFEVAIGQNDNELRLALNFKREIGVIANETNNGNTGWFKVLGTTSLRNVVEKAFNLPPEFANLDIDRQVATLKSGSSREFGSDDFSVFQNTANIDQTIEKFLVRSQISNQGVGASAALTILQGNSGSGTLEALFAALY